jgi:hypothetical protein
MQLFTRTIHMAGPEAEVGAHAAALREYVSTKIGLEVALWSIGFGAPVGSMAYTARVDGIAGVQAMGAALQGDKDYAKMVAKGSDWVTGAPVDSLRESLSGDLTATPPPVGSVATLTTAVISNGRYADAIGWGLDVAAHVTTVTGMPVGFMMDMFGTFGQVAWIGIAADGAAADAANAKLNVDPGYMEKLGGATDLFVQGASHRSLAYRVA